MKLTARQIKNIEEKQRKGTLEKSDWKKLEKHMVACLQGISDFATIKLQRGNAKIDCKGRQVFVELKWRFTNYAQPTTMLEQYKYKHLVRAMSDGVHDYAYGVFYAVQSNGLIYVFYINELEQEDYDYNWHYLGNPTTSHLDSKTDGKMIPKLISLIPWYKAKMVIDFNGKLQPVPQPPTGFVYNE